MVGGPVDGFSMLATGDDKVIVVRLDGVGHTYVVDRTNGIATYKEEG